ncbi:MAG: hypothetical protein HYZ45_02450 [Burkholderiales bacterium]|nr:hypothetical protein [Burkholderiales bacterium]
MSNEIRRPLYTGTQQVRALWFDPSLIGAQEARRRVLQHWCLGASLYEVLDGYLLQWPSARNLHCATLDGLALCEIQVEGKTLLSSAPLHAAELHEVARGSVCLVFGAQLCINQLVAKIDPSIWLDLRQISLHEPVPFPVTPTRMQDVPAARSVREIFGVGDFISAEQAAKNADKAAANKRQADTLMPNVQTISHGQASKTKQNATNGRYDIMDVAARMSEAKDSRSFGAGGGRARQSQAEEKPSLRQALQKTLGFFGIGRKKAPDTAPPSTGIGTDHFNQKQASSKTAQIPKDKISYAAPQDSGWQQKISQWMNKATGATPLGSLLEERQAQYMRKIQAMFENGDIASALLHAVPLSDGRHSPVSSRSFGLPGVRANLTISAGGSAGHKSAIYTRHDVNEYWRKIYRNAYEREVQAGNLDRAVFILAELLRCGEEAVDLLEKHQRFQQAAELAEVLELKAELAIRLWCLHGDFARAALLALVHGRFAEAVELMERKNHAQALDLRRLWAQHLAASGDLLLAVNAIWPLEAEREQALQWLLLAEQSGGLMTALALLRRLQLQPESLAQSEAALQSIAWRQDEIGQQQRARIVQEMLPFFQHNAATKNWTAALLPALIADRIAGHNSLSNKDLDQLLHAAGNHVLREDLPKFKLDSERKASSAEFTFTCEEMGLLHIYDACRLPDHEYLLALGEAGVIKVNRHGKRLAHYPLPAHELVPARNGMSALGLALRDSCVHVGKIDLLRGKVSDWQTLACQFWAKDFDGQIWDVVLNNQLLSLNTHEAQLTTVWKVADLPGRILEFNTDSSYLSFTLDDDISHHFWRYTLPERRLLNRDAVPEPTVKVWLRKMSAHRVKPVDFMLRKSDDNTTLQIDLGIRYHQIDIELGAIIAAPTIHFTDQTLCVVSRTQESHRCQLFDMSVSKICSLSITDAEYTRTRMQDGRLLVFDRNGRLLDFDIAERSLHHLCLN